MVVTVLKGLGTAYGYEAAGVVSLVSGCQAEASRAALNTEQLVVQQLWSEGEERKGATLPDFSNNNSQPTPLLVHHHLPDLDKYSLLRQ